MGGAAYVDEKATLIEAVSAKVHEAWMTVKTDQGGTEIKSETGEELIAKPYDQLSEAAKGLYRDSVRSAISAIEAAGFTIAPAAAKA